MSTVYTFQVGAITWRYQLSGGNASIGNGTTTNGNATNLGTGLSGAITIPATVGAQNYPVTIISQYAFRSCMSITSVTIPNSVIIIGSNAFEICRALTLLTIGNSVQAIDGNAFYDCRSLTSLTIPSTVFSIGNSAFQACTGLTSLTIPNLVTTINVNAFAGCTGLTSVTIGTSVTTIGNGAFSACSNLVSITIPISVTYIGLYSFSACANLASITIPNLVTYIGYQAFYNCTLLVSINIPDLVTFIGDMAFTGTSANLTITMNNNRTIRTIAYPSPATNQSFFGNTSVDFVLPLTMTITSTTPGVTSGSTTKNETIALTFTSSASTSDFVAGDITLTNGSLNSSFGGSGSVYNATFTPTGQGACTIDVSGNKFTSAGQNNVASNTFNWTFDSVSPSMTITSTTPGVTSGSTTKNTFIDLTFTSTEATNNFVVGDISVTNGTLSIFGGSGAVYTARFTPTGPGACTIGVLQGVYTDAATNLNNLATQFNWTFDNDYGVSIIAWPETMLRASNSGEGDWFGASVAISGNYAIVGAYQEDGTSVSATTDNCGAAYIFERNTGTGAWSEKQILRANNLGGFDNFGFSVAISGNYAIVGARTEDGTSVSATTDECGAAYIFERDGSGNWIQKTILRASNLGAGDSFGWSVAISGNYAIVGATGEDGTSISATTDNCGAAYIFERDGSGNWTQNPTILRASNLGTGDQFGRSVAISGNYAIVGTREEDGTSISATTDNCGAAYIFERDGSGNWAETKILRASNLGAGDNFGHSVAISGNYAIVGARYEDGSSDQIVDSGAAYIFERDGSGNWTEKTILRASNLGPPDQFGYNDDFGHSVAISGNYAIVGARYEDGSSTSSTFNCGATYVFVRDNSGVWTEQNILRASNLGLDDNFGNSVAIDGTYVIIGALAEDGSSASAYFDSGAAYIYSVVPTYTYIPTPLSFVDNKLTIANTIDATDTDVVSFQLTAGNKLYPLSVSSFSGSGTVTYSLDISGGANVKSGTFSSAGPSLLPGDGSLTASANTTYILTITSNAAISYTIVGYLDYGTQQLVGYSLTSLNEQICGASNFELNDYFGNSVAISGNYAIVAASQEDGSNISAEFNSGAAYIFERNDSGNWTEKQILRASNAATLEYFGGSVAISGNYAIVGAARSIYSGDYAGAAYIFERDGSGNWIQKPIIRASNLSWNSQFGTSVAISGTYAIVGARLEDAIIDNGDFNNGAAYIFERDGSGNWLQKPILRASNLGQSDIFGISVAISGNYAIVGAFGEDGSSAELGFNCGAAYIFERTSGTWSEKAILRANNFGRDDNFGGSVAISGNYAIVGAMFEDGSSTSATTDDCGAAYIFERDGSGNWIQKTILRASNLGAGDNFGNSVAISGNYAIVGAINEDGTNIDPNYDCGAVYIFERDVSGNWNEKNIIRASNPSQYGSFGNSVAISGTTFLVGSQIASITSTSIYRSGAAYFYSANPIYTYSPTPVAFVNNTLTITNSIDSTDIDPVSFALTAGNKLYPFSVTSFTGTGTISYRLDISGGANVKTGTFSANNFDLLTGTPVTASGNTTYILTLTANAAIEYTIVGSLLTSPTNIILSNNSVNELQPIGTTIGTLTCDNPNNSAITYSVSDITRFSIAGSTLKTNVIFDFETTSSYTVTITASIGGLSSSSSKTITVINISGEAAELRRQNLQGPALKTAADSQTTPITATDLKAAGYNATELKAAVYSATQLKSASFTAAELKDASFTATELKAANYSATELKAANYSAAELKAVSYTLDELITAQYTAANLKAAEYTVADLKAKNFSLADLKSGGYTATEMKSSYLLADLISGGYSVNELKEASFTATELKAASVPLADLISGGYTVTELKAALFTATELKAASVPLADLISGGYNANELKAASFTATELKAANVSLADLVSGGYSANELKAAAYTAAELKAASVPLADLISGGYSVNEMKAASFTATELKAASVPLADLISGGYTVTELKAALFTATELKAASVPLADLISGGYNANELKAASFTATELKAASFTATELKAGGYSATELKAAAFSTTELKAAAFTATELKAAAFNATELKAGGYSATELKAAAFSATELKAAAFSATELKAAAFSATELKVAEFNATELKAGGFSATELKAAAFSATELKAGGYSATELKAAAFSATELKAAAFNATELKVGGYNATELKTALFNATELRAAAFTATELKTALFTATELNTGGFSATELKSAAYTATEMKSSYTLVQLISGGYIATELRAAAFTVAELYSTSSFSLAELKSGGYTALEMKSSYSLAELIAGAYNATELKAASYTVSELTSSFTLAQLKTGGYSATEMKTSFSLVQLISGGYNATELKAAAYTVPELTSKFTFAQLKTGGYTAVDMKTSYSLNSLITGGYNATELKAAAYTAAELKSKFTLAQLKTGGYTPAEMKAANFSVEQLKAGGYTVAEMTSSYTVAELKAGGYSAVEMSSVYSLDQLIAGGYSAAELKAAAYTVAELKSKGFTIAQLKSGGYTATEMKSSYTLSELIDGGYSAAELKAAVYSVADLTSRFTLAQLKSGGYSATEMKSSYTLAQLISGGYNAAELKAAEYTVAELKLAGVSLAQLKAGGYTVAEMISSYTFAELKDGGYTAAQMKSSYSLDQLIAGGYNAAELKSADFTVTELTAKNFSFATLKAGGYSATEMDAVYSLDQLIGGGYSAVELRGAAYTVADLTDKGFSFAALKGGGYSALEMKSTYTLDQLISGGYNATELRAAAYTVADLTGKGFVLTQLKLGGYTVAEMTPTFSLADLKSGGYTAAQMTPTFSLAELKTGGYTAAEFRDSNFTAVQLNDAGFTIDQLKTGGYTATQMTPAFSLADLKTAGYTAAELRDSNFSAVQLKDAAFTIGQLKTGGYSAAQMKVALYSASQLKTAGYTVAQMKDAVYSAAELNNVGYTSFQLVDGGFNVASLLILGIVPDWNVFENANCITTSYVQDFVDVSGSIILRENANMYINGNVEIDGNVALNRLVVNADASISRSIFVGGDVSMNINVAMIGDISMNGTVTKCSFNNSSIPKSAFASTVPEGPNYNTPKIVYDQKFQANADVSMNGPTVASNNVTMSGNIVFNDGTVMNTYDNNISTTNPPAFKASIFSSLDICGNLVAGSYATSSDYRIKTNVVELDETYTVDKLRPVKYFQTHINREKYGLIAHELQEHYPDLVIGEKDGSELQRVNYMGLIAILINDIKRMKRELEVLELQQR